MGDRDRKREISLISFFDLRGSLHPDTTFAKEYIGTWVPHDGTRLCADEGYYSHEVSELAQSEGIFLCFTHRTGQRGNPNKLRASTFVRDTKNKGNHTMRETGNHRAAIGGVCSALKNTYGACRLRCVVNEELG
ncbi:hypothetical protein [Pasteuria penetrans]|uniref:hypothetical protein n=1 Tax=Pasteuria penetrans TaxID=86005 RepID=UPI000FAA07C8|nr:hypothetical protein [Pasteuria penetrans]